MIRKTLGFCLWLIGGLLAACCLFLSIFSLIFRNIVSTNWITITALAASVSHILGDLICPELYHPGLAGEDK